MTSPGKIIIFAVTGLEIIAYYTLKSEASQCFFKSGIQHSHQESIIFYNRIL
jgi:hypothetical protein